MRATLTAAVLTCVILLGIGCDAAPGRDSEVRPQSRRSEAPASRPTNSYVQTSHATTEKLRLAILPFRSERHDPDSGDMVMTAVMNKLLETGEYEISERAELRKLLEEQDIQESDLADVSTARRIGKLANVDAVLIGQVCEWKGVERHIPIPVPWIGPLPIPNHKYTVQVSARIVNLGSSTVQSAMLGRGKSRSNIMEAADRVAVELVKQIRKN